MAESPPPPPSALSCQVQREATAQSAEGAREGEAHHVVQDEDVTAAVLAKEEEVSAEELTEAERAASLVYSDEVKQDPSMDVLARGIASVMGPVMHNFDAGVEGALKSQSVLASSIDRLTRELDKLLEDVPHPYATQHATRLSGIRRRLLSLNTSLRIIQKRMDMIKILLPGFVSKTTSRVIEEADREGSPTTPSYDSLQKPLSFSSNEDGDENGTLNNDGGRAGLDGLQDDHTSDELASKEHNLNGKRADEDAMDAVERDGSLKASRSCEESGDHKTVGD